MVLARIADSLDLFIGFAGGAEAVERPRTYCYSIGGNAGGQG